MSLNTQNFPFIMKRKKIAVEWSATPGKDSGGTNS